MMIYHVSLRRLDVSAISWYCGWICINAFIVTYGSVKIAQKNILANKNNDLYSPNV